MDVDNRAIHGGASCLAEIELTPDLEDTMPTAVQIYQNIAALRPVERILEEVDKALDDRGRTIATSDIPEMLGGVAGGAIGVGVGLTLVYTSGVAGVSAAGITTGLATLGAIIGGGMMAGIFVAATPMAVLGVAGYAVVARQNRNRLMQTKEALFQEAVRKHDAILRELNTRIDTAEERNQYLSSLLVLLQRAIDDLRKDLGK